MQMVFNIGNNVASSLYHYASNVTDILLCFVSLRQSCRILRLPDHLAVQGIGLSANRSTASVLPSLHHSPPCVGAMIAKACFHKETAMTAHDPRTVRLAEYQPFSHLVDQVALTFQLDPQATRVRARLQMRPNPAARAGQDLRLDGEGLALQGCWISGVLVQAAPDSTGLTLAASILPDGPFVLETEVLIAPAGNTALEGLYMSNGMYCTQCEAEGFRKITFYPDRPDVMARFHVRIESDLPVLLSNGNPVAQGAGWAEREDPCPKPS